MKLTKSQLKQIIKEEISQMLEDRPKPGQGPLSGAHLDLGPDGDKIDFWALREDVDDVIKRLTRLREILHNISGVFEGKK
tara:strand:- start:229 stop:468 length:240 start_codon:yes stop_codon:yes gene_type:complete